MARRLIPLLLLALLVVVWAQLWIGRGSLPDVRQMQIKLADQEAQSAQARRDNERLAAEVRDLQEGLEMVEEKARMELGMVKPNEILVQIKK